MGFFIQPTRFMCLECDERLNLTSVLESEDSIIITNSYCKVVLNQRANRIHVFGLWQEVQFEICTWKCRKWIIITKSYCRLVLNQRANRIHVFGLWRVVQFDIWTWKCRTWSITTMLYCKVVLNHILPKNAETSWRVLEFLDLYVFSLKKSVWMIESRRR